MALSILLAGTSLFSLSSRAQEERPQIMPGERKPAKKKDSGPRAVGVLQLGQNGKASLVPIAILVDGKFWDASAYKADPVPMALEPGTVYEAEHGGSSLGLFTIGAALHSNSANIPNPWIGTGAWVPAGSEKPRTSLKAETAPRGIEVVDAPPKLSRTSPKANGNSAPTSTTAPPANTPQNNGGGSSGDEPPKLNKPAPASTPPSGSTPSGQTQPAPGSSTPDSKAPSSTDPSSTAPKGDAKPGSHPQEPESDSGTDEANRPRLRRGKPVGPLPDDDFPGYSRPGASRSSANATNAAKAADGAPAKENIQTIPAISDAGGPYPRSFAFEWLKDEEGERRQQMETMAKQQVRAYLDARNKAQNLAQNQAQNQAKIAAKPAVPQTARHSVASKPVEPILENVQMVAYDLWTSNQPIIVFSADAHMPPPAGSHAGVDSGLPYSVLLVAYPDIYGNLRKLYVGVTDKFHLDVTPRLELIDAVDADGDGRGELLFREISDAGSGWVIYRATADKLWKMFDSQSPE